MSTAGVSDTPATHVVIPDTQVKPGVPLDHLNWIGRYIRDQFYGKSNVTIVHLGDHWDMPSLSQWDQGKFAMEGRRVSEDIESGNQGIRLLDEPTADRNAMMVRDKKAKWLPRKVLLRGNHEWRVNAYLELHPNMRGFLSESELRSPGWEVHPFLRPVYIDGIGYAHFWQNPMTGKPLGGMAATRLKTVGHSFTMGHQQVLDHAIRFVAGQSQHALIAGACYLHDEDYKGYQGNAHWRGIIVCHQVEDGSYDPMFISLDYLCRRYEGVRLREFTPYRFPILEEAP